MADDLAATLAERAPALPLTGAGSSELEAEPKPSEPPNKLLPPVLPYQGMRSYYENMAEAIKDQVGAELSRTGCWV
jgi:hypothetical protein